MFTWREIRDETAQRLLDYENQQGALVQLLTEMGDEDLPVIKLKDQIVSSGTEIVPPLEEYWMDDDAKIGEQRGMLMDETTGHDA